MEFHSYFQFIIFLLAMNKFKTIAILFFTILLISCSNEEWYCQTMNKSMFSMSSSGSIGSADKSCTCEQMRQFEFQTFGKVDEESLKSDFGCY